MSLNLNEFVKFANLLADSASQTSMKYFRKKLEVDNKDNYSAKCLDTDGNRKDCSISDYDYFTKQIYNDDNLVLLFEVTTPGFYGIRKYDGEKNNKYKS